MLKHIGERERAIIERREESQRKGGHMIREVSIRDKEIEREAQRKGPREIERERERERERKK